MKQDRTLIGILMGIIVLMAISLVTFFLRGTEQNYKADDSPENIVRNYILALHKEDYRRAYGYLQDASAKPSFTEFRQNFVEAYFKENSAGVQIRSMEIIADEALVNLLIIHGGTRPFDSSWDEHSDAWLILQKNQWKLSFMPYPYWGWDWYVESEQ